MSYTLTSAEDLAGLAYLMENFLISSYFNGIDFTFDNVDGKIDLSAHFWVPICDGLGFEGNFDGRGIVIDGLRIGTEAAPLEYYYQGLFGAVSVGGTIKNIGLENGEIYGTDSSSGSIVGSNGGTIENCYNTGSVSGTEVNGGIAGYNGGTIRNCYNTGSVSGTEHSGGIVGINNGTIENCYNTGSVYGTEYNGGIAGLNNAGTIENCYNTGSVSGTERNGGIVGSNSGTIENCYNTGSVSGTEYNGGIVGYSSGVIENCYNRGEVISSIADAGPLVGNDGGTTTNSYWLDSIGFPFVAGESLSLDEMTGGDAITTMNLGSGWVSKENVGRTYFFPQLEVFTAGDSVWISDSLNSVTLFDGIDVLITQTETPIFEKGQKLSDLNPADYVTITPDVPGTFSWKTPEMVFDTLGDFTAVIIFTPMDATTYLPSEINADITIKAVGPEPKAHAGSLLFFIVAVITLGCLFYIGVVKEE